MAIVTRRRADKFTIIPNDIVGDRSLSFEAIGLLCYLLSKPNDWSVEIEHLRRHGNIGKDKVYRILNDLIAARLIARVVHRAGNGRVTEVEYVVYNERQPLPEKPETAKPETVQPETDNPDVLIRTEKHQELNLVERATQPLSFETWWELYPEKVGKGAARTAFERALRKAPAEALIAGVQRYIASKPADRAWCHPSTWLNQERWTDQPSHHLAKLRDTCQAKPRDVATAAAARLKQIESEGATRAIEHQ